MLALAALAIEFVVSEFSSEGAAFNPLIATPGVAPAIVGVLVTLLATAAALEEGDVLIIEDGSAGSGGSGGKLSAEDEEESGALFSPRETCVLSASLSRRSFSCN